MTDETFFIQHAFFFLANADRILQDERMAASPIDMGNNLAYLGRNGLAGATLGVYLQWWIDNRTARHDGEGRDALTYFFAGSPLSGQNSCRCVYPDGTTAKLVHREFLPLWSSFIKLNKQPKPTCTPYSIAQVHDMLQAEGRTATASHDTEHLLWEAKVRDLVRQHQQLQDSYDAMNRENRRLRDDYAAVCMKLHRDVLTPLVDEYRHMQAEALKQAEELMAHRCDLRKKHREGHLADKEFQQAMMQVQRQLRKVKEFLADFDEAMFLRELPVFYEEYTRLLSRPDIALAIAEKHAPKQEANPPAQRTGAMRQLNSNPAPKELTDLYLSRLDKLSLGNSTIFCLIDKYLNH